MKFLVLLREKELLHETQQIEEALRGKLSALEEGEEDSTERER